MKIIQYSRSFLNKRKINKHFKNNIKLLFVSYKNAPILFTACLLIVLILGIWPMVQLKYTEYFVNKTEEYVTTIKNTVYWLKFFMPLISYQFIIWIVNALLSSVEHSIKEVAGRKTNIFVSKRLAEKSLSIPLLDFEKEEIYKKHTLANNNIKNVSGVIEIGGAFIRTFINLLSVIGIIFLLNWGFALILIVIAIMQFIIKKKVEYRNWSSIVHSAPENIKMNYFESILKSKESAKELRIFNAFEFFFAKREFFRKELFKRHLGRLYKSSSINILINIMNNIVYIILCIFLITGLKDDGQTVGSIIMVFSAIPILQSSLNMISTFFLFLDQNMKGLTFVSDFLFFKDEFPQEEKRFEQFKVDKNEEGIRLQNVSFKYPNSAKYVLKNISLFIPKNNKVSFVGVNGAGKTTLIKIIMGIYKPTSGHVYLDGKELQNYDAGSINKKFSAIFQNFAKYNMTIKDNIAFNCKQDKKKLNDILKKVGLDEFANKTETFIGPSFGGIDLSGGQWQKLALARMLFKDSEILILDEPTASLDIRSEYKFVKNFSEIFIDKTNILISHRFSTVKETDYIYLIDSNRILEQGTHKELMQKKGNYYNLYIVQEVV